MFCYVASHKNSLEQKIIIIKNPEKHQKCYSCLIIPTQNIYTNVVQFDWSRTNSKLCLYFHHKNILI